MVDKKNDNQTSEANHCHKVTVAGRELVFLPGHKSLLECLEAENIDVHYHCRDGFCGAYFYA